MKTNYALMLAATLASVLLVQPVLSDDQLTPAVPATPAGAAETNKIEAAPVPAPTGAAKKSTASSTKGAATAKKKVVAAEPLVPAIPLTPGPAIARERNVNVRGQAAINSEVITRLKRGDRVTVLEEVTLKKPKTDEPAIWAKIALPTNSTVWVHSSFIDATSKAVIPKRLNLRSGPSENYSVVGRIEKGTVVKEIETKGEWIKIEPPAGAYGFVAAHLLLNDVATPTTPTIAAAEPPKTPTAPATPAAPVAVVVPPTEMTVVTNEPVPPTPTEITPPSTPATPAVPPTVVSTPPGVTPLTPAPADPGVAAPGVPAAPVVAPPAEPEQEESLVKRVITREGVVKRSASIQAPSYFELVSLDTGKCVNYLHSTNSNLALKDYRGLRIVVTGEEQLDERWPNIPVIYVDSVQPAPAE